MHITNKKLRFDIFTVGNYEISSWNMILIKVLIIFGLK